MKILELTDSLGNGGAEKFLVELSNDLAKNNKVTLCSTSNPDDSMLPYKKINNEVNFISLNSNGKFNILLFFRLMFLLKNIKPDVIHIHSSILVFYGYILSGIFRNILFLQTIHNTLTPGYIKLMNYINKLRFFNKNFINVCISKNIYDDYKIRYPKLIFRHIDNGIYPVDKSEKYSEVTKKITALKKSDSGKVFIAIGNYSDFKNFIMLVNVFTELNIIRNDFVLLILGTGKGDNFKNYKEVSRVKSDNIYQLGFIENVSDYIIMSDALVISSTMEGMPLVVLESLCAGLPVISTPAGGIPDIIESGVNGFVCKDYSAEGLKNEVLKFLLLNSSELNLIRNNNIKKFHKNYSMKICSENYLNLFREYI